jgi:hypothetical protein
MSGSILKGKPFRTLERRLCYFRPISGDYRGDNTGAAKSTIYVSLVDVGKQQGNSELGRVKKLYFDPIIRVSWYHMFTLFEVASYPIAIVSIASVLVDDHRIEIPCHPCILA